jgi:hypothetical protein
MVCLLVGGGATWYVWHSALTEGVYGIKMAVIGAMVIPLGIGFLIHGERLPRFRVTPLMRVYGILGAIAAAIFIC